MGYFLNKKAKSFLYFYPIYFTNLCKQQKKVKCKLVLEKTNKSLLCKNQTINDSFLNHFQNKKKNTRTNILDIIKIIICKHQCEDRSEINV